MRGVWIVLGIAAAAALPASAQRAAAEIALVESAAPAGAIVLGEVRAEIHQASLIARTPARDLADKELRAQAAKLGADAVVDIRYENNSPLFSKKGFRAAGKAVKFSQAPVQVAAAAQPPPVPEPARTVDLCAAPAAHGCSRAVCGGRTPAPPVVVNVAPVAPAVCAATSNRDRCACAGLASAGCVGPSLTNAGCAISRKWQRPPPPAPVAPPVAQPAPVATAIPPAPRGPTPEALIVLTEEDLLGRTYDRLGEVSATARQTSLFPKKSARVLMDEQLRAGRRRLARMR